jgi:hypothetical protein
MGCGMSTEEKEGKARNEEIENQLKRDKMLQRNEIKMLLLGKPPHFVVRLSRAVDGFFVENPTTDARDADCHNYSMLTKPQVPVNPESRPS